MTAGERAGKFARASIRTILLMIGLAVATALWITSALNNFEYSQSWADTNIEEIIYALAYVSADAAKALIPVLVAIFVPKEWTINNAPRFLVAMLLWFVCVIFSIAAAIGFASTNRSDTISNRTSILEHRKEMNRLESKIKSKNVNPVSWYDAKIKKVLDNPLSKTASGKSCDGDYNGPYTRKWCPKVEEWKAKRAIALEVVSYKNRLNDLRNTIGNKNVQIADPQAEMISAALGTSLSATQMMLSALQAALIELGAAFGFFVMLGNSSPKPREEKTETTTKEFAIQDVILSLEDKKLLKEIGKEIRQNNGEPTTIIHREIAKRLNWSDSKTYRKIIDLAEREIINRTVNGKKTLVSITSY